MGIAKLPFHIGLLERELLSCVEDTQLLANRLKALQKALLCPQASNFFKQQQKVSVLLFLEPSVERTIYQRILEELDCWVEIANTLDTACNASCRGFDLVLFDLEQAGLEAVAQLKKGREKFLPLLAALTNFAPPSLKIMGLKHLIQKPTDTYLIKIPLLKILSEIVVAGGEVHV